LLLIGNAAPAAAVLRRLFMQTANQGYQEQHMPPRLTALKSGQVLFETKK